MESKNPRRDLPIGIIGSLTITTVLYIAFCTVMTGAANYTTLGGETPVTTAVDAVQQRTGKSFLWLNIIVTLGALFGLTSVLLVMLLGQSRVFYSMAQDGLLPSVFAKVHPRFKTPYVTTIVVGGITAILAAVLPVDLLGNMTSVGTLLAFFIVHGGVILLRFTRPDVQRGFKVPGGKYLFAIFPLIGMVISILLLAVAEVTTIWVRGFPFTLVFVKQTHSYFYSVCLSGWVWAGSSIFLMVSGIPGSIETPSAALEKYAHTLIRTPRKMSSNLSFRAVNECKKLSLVCLSFVIAYVKILSISFMP